MLGPCLFGWEPCMVKLQASGFWGAFVLGNCWSGAGGMQH
jgi:hypothetical protein